MQSKFWRAAALIAVVLALAGLFMPVAPESPVERTAQTQVYIEPGASKLVVASGGELEVQDGAILDIAIDSTAVTTNTTMTTAMNGDVQVLQNESTTTVTMALPAAAAGLNYCIFNYDGDDIAVDPATGDQIAILTNAAGDKVTNTTAGNFLCLLALDTTYWINVGSAGTWTDAN